MLVKKLLIVLVVSLMLTFSVTGQNTPADVRDLVGDRASSGERQLRNRGYTFVKTRNEYNRRWSNWWKQSTSTCITVETFDGRFDSIVTSRDFECNRGGGGGGSVNPPNWAEGTFYGIGPEGERITLTINRNGNASAVINNRTYYGNYSRGNYLTIDGARSRVTRQGSGIVTTRVDNGERINYSRSGWDGGNDGGSGSTIAPPSWARGTFYGISPQGDRITLTINRNGNANAVIGDETYYGNYSRGNYLTIDGARSRVTRQGNGIVTTRVDNGERINYSRSGWDGGNDGGSGDTVTPPSWAQGAFYGIGPRGERITLIIGRDGNASANVNGGMSYGNYSRGNYLTIDGARSRVTRQGNGIVTTRVDNGERIVYSRSDWDND